MQIAICNETFQGWTILDTCRFASQLGYQGLEIAPFTLASSADQVTQAQRQSIVAAAKDFNLEIIGLHWLLAGTEGFYLTNPEPTVFKRTVDYFHHLIQLCADLGSPKQRNRLPGFSHHEASAAAAKLIGELTTHLADTNIVLAIEPLGPEEGDFLNTAQSAIQLIQQIDSPNVLLHLDVKAMSTQAVSYEEIIHSSAKYLHHFHANDPNRQGPGMGKVDFTPIIKALNDVGYRQWLSVEVFDYAPGPEALATQSIDYLKKMLGQAD